jgi:peptidyl-prolyl cis-trans isomerase A (cyclophilin A)
MTIRTLLGMALAAALTLAAPARAQDHPAGPAQPPKEGGQPPATPAEPAHPPKAEEKLVYVAMKTSMGQIVLELNNEKAPISTQNFLAYSDKKFYDGTIFHRVIPNFMVQGGGFTADLQQKGTDKQIKNEWQNGLKNKKYTVAMARLGGPGRADSATSQFFINVNDNAFLDEPRDGAGYAVFGRVVAGTDVVDAIAKVPTGRKNGMGDVPNEAVVIESVRRLTPDEAAKYRG